MYTTNLHDRQLPYLSQYLAKLVGSGVVGTHDDDLDKDSRAHSRPRGVMAIIGVF